mmetsp:Transcript_29952/g.48337  ORF Transcript_29952/g.48337 Transcript_29952/m.48337 type:complete len:82 (-) Transcript_29952:30-275(-)
MPDDIDGTRAPQDKDAMTRGTYLCSAMYCIIQSEAGKDHDTPYGNRIQHIHRETRKTTLGTFCNERLDQRFLDLMLKGTYW